MILPALLIVLALVSGAAAASPEEAITPLEASAMFSRHGVDLLRQLAADAEIFANPE